MPGLNLVRMYYGNTFDLISRSPATKVCLLWQIILQCKVKRQFFLQVSRYCLLDFQGRIVIRVPLLALIFPMTQCVFRLI